MEEWFDFLAIALAVGGFHIASLGIGDLPDRRFAVRYRVGGWCLIGSGLCLILGQLSFAGAFLLVAAAVLSSTVSRLRFFSLSEAMRRGVRFLVLLRGCVRRRTAVLWRFLFLLLLFETWETAVLPGAGSHSVEIGFACTLLALAAVGWAAVCSGGETCGWERLAPAPGRASVARRSALLAGSLFVGFVLLVGWIQLPSVHAFDVAFGQRLFKSGSPDFTGVMRALTTIGGRELLVYWLPLLLLLVGVTRKLRAAVFFAATMLGTVGLELLSKGSVGRLRPEFVRGGDYDSFPSGHVLAATILAGTLVAIYLPVCRYRWQRACLWTGAVAWPLLMALSRIYLGRHFLTDVVGAWLLGSAWVLAALALSLTLARPRRATTRARASAVQEQAAVA